jgi:peroxiredoxin
LKKPLGKIFTLLLFFALNSVFKISFGQKFVKISGQILGFNEEEVTLTLYKDWVQKPHEYALKLDNKKFFSFEAPLDDLAFCDLNVGEYGFFAWKVEPDDRIFLEAKYDDFYKTIKISGIGSSKWHYLLKQEEVFQREKDWDYELNALNKISKKGFFDLTNFLRQEQLNLLNDFKPQISEDFYSLQRAEIDGKYSSIELGYLISHNLFNQEVFNDFNLKVYNSKTQTKSLEYGKFVETLLENNNKIANKYSSSKLVEIETLKDYFDIFDKVDRSLIERIIASRIYNSLEKEGASEENKLLVGSFRNYSKNQSFIEILNKKINKFQSLLKGKQAPEFILKDSKNNLVSLKDFRGKTVILAFFAGWCEPCIEDLIALNIVRNYFKDKTNIELLSISLDLPQDFKILNTGSKIPGILLSGYDNKFLIENYNLDQIPNYLIIDKSGTIIIDKIEEPSIDEGRSLIKYLEENILSK